MIDVFLAELMEVCASVVEAMQAHGISDDRAALARVRIESSGPDGKINFHVYLPSASSFSDSLKN